MMMRSTTPLLNATLALAALGTDAVDLMKFAPIPRGDYGVALRPPGREGVGNFKDQRGQTYHRDAKGTIRRVETLQRARSSNS